MVSQLREFCLQTTWYPKPKRSLETKVHSPKLLRHPSLPLLHDTLWLLSPLCAALIGQMCTFSYGFSKQQAVSSTAARQLLSQVVVCGICPAVAPISCLDFNKAGQFQRGSAACSVTVHSCRLAGLVVEALLVWTAGQVMFWYRDRRWRLKAICFTPCRCGF